MTQDEWDKRRKQNIRQTAINIAKEIHKTNSKAIKEQQKEQEEKEEVKIIFPEEVIEDAAMIEKYIQKGQKVYKDNR